MSALYIAKSPKMEAIVSKRVLIIDDEEPVVIVVQSCFEDIAGWHVLTAASGHEGLIIAEVEQPDAIVLDVMMPGMDGLTFLRKLKANVATQFIPVILLTAKVGLIEPLQAAALGLTGAIAKPFDPILLADQVADFLGWTMEP
jgi:CheY-like chemotaxis protein